MIARPLRTTASLMLGTLACATSSGAWADMGRFRGMDHARPMMQVMPRMQMLPALTLSRCGGVEQKQVDAAYRAALAVVRARKLDERAFEAQISHRCPRRDLDYFQRVMKL